jgi:threonine/homoserine/homoserine lactone efflux protein
MFYAAAQTLASGRKAGWWSALGFHIAGLGHVAAAAFGVSTLLAVVPTLFTVMKFVGAAYLIWLGIKYLRGARLLVSAPRKPPAPTARKALRDSVIVEAMNPKSALFYFAFLPQFTGSSAELPIWVQIVVLGVIVNAMFSVTDAHPDRDVTCSRDQAALFGTLRPRASKAWWGRAHYTRGKLGLRAEPMTQSPF